MARKSRAEEIARLKAEMERMDEDPEGYEEAPSGPPRAGQRRSRWSRPSKPVQSVGAECEECGVIFERHIQAKVGTPLYAERLCGRNCTSDALDRARDKIEEASKLVQLLQRAGADVYALLDPVTSADIRGALAAWEIPEVLTKKVPKPVDILK